MCVVAVVHADAVEENSGADGAAAGVGGIGGQDAVVDADRESVFAGIEDAEFVFVGEVRLEQEPISLSSTQTVVFQWARSRKRWMVLPFQSGAMVMSCWYQATPR